MVSGKEGATECKSIERRDEIYNKLNDEKEGRNQEVVNIIREIKNKLHQKEGDDKWFLDKLKNHGASMVKELVIAILMVRINYWHDN